ncbi:SET domain protein [Drechmeria coniospora]|uniref:SET domain protein n=1 Tax=Drechmeria coniospora TaxID=98403 RepID=A0A151GMM1_DRECN|nr:SET domain protein [Drechmeria coniospora]KYK58346.1 SET domain protein [Drechmeria coniospora]
MPAQQLPLSAFPAWARLNEVALTKVTLQHVNGKGCGLVADEEMASSSADAAPAVTAATTTADPPATELMKIPHDLVLSAEAVEEYAKIDQNFSLLRDAAGRKERPGWAEGHHLDAVDDVRRLPTPRGARADLVVRARTHAAERHFVGGEHSGPEPRRRAWRRQATTWRNLVAANTPQVALEAKLSTLAREFDELRETSQDMPFWSAMLWGRGGASLEDWMLADAWYRSRCLELPVMGDAMVPGLDMINHASRPTAYYEVDGDGDVVLLARPGRAMARGREVTISYGVDKSAAEMLFSYGFIDGDAVARELTLHLDPLPDDPLAKAKLHVFGRPPTVRFSRSPETDAVEFESQFVFLMCLNEEDGLEFRLLQDTSGGRQLRLLWQGEDVTDRATEFESLVRGHELRDVFRLRAVTVLHQRVEGQTSKNKAAQSETERQALGGMGSPREERAQAARALLEAELQVLEAAAEALENEVRPAARTRMDPREYEARWAGRGRSVGGTTMLTRRVRADVQPTRPRRRGGIPRIDGRLPDRARGDVAKVQ